MITINEQKMTRSLTRNDKKSQEITRNLTKNDKILQKKWQKMTKKVTRMSLFSSTFNNVFLSF